MTWFFSSLLGRGAGSLENGKDEPEGAGPASKAKADNRQPDLPVCQRARLPARFGAMWRSPDDGLCLRVPLFPFFRRLPQCAGSLSDAREIYPGIDALIKRL